ncbi:MAG: S9 family peptidase [Candidatus Dormibacteraeota bacterium]|nr:S9 family peptidase [Candidatus Dormibacteraeota bacterium]
MIAPYGAWASTITIDVLLNGAVVLKRSMPRWDGDDLYWTELRPTEAGRLVIVRRSGGAVTDVTPEGYNARTRVHEYGGGQYAVSGGTVWFTNFSDQRLYRQERDADPVPITPDADIRHADLLVDPSRGRIFSVREDHSTGAAEPVNTLVAVDWQGRREAVTVAEGNDFYSSPRLSPGGDRLAWLTWNHPNMPWDGTELWVGELDTEGRVKSARQVAGGRSESIYQPEWSPAGELYFVSDRNDWWNLYRIRGETEDPVCRRAAEFGAPQWNFGMTSYAFLDGAEIVCLYSETGGTKLGRVDTREGTIKQIDLLYTSLSNLVLSARRVAMVAASPTLSERILVVDVDTAVQEVVKVSNPARIDPGYLSTPQAIEFPTEGGLTAHALYYPPKNKDYEAPPHERTPMVVHCHGGPTDSVSSSFNLEYQYWTSRGFAIVDVNYGGSSGYGRSYRQRLNGSWGVVDVDDCINAARYLVERDVVDAERLAISGGSAGGFTTLVALTKRDFFNAGASHFGIGDLVTFVKETHKFESRYLDTLIGPYPEREDLYRDRSAVNFADNLNCPVILFQGLEDKVVPPSQAEEFVAVCEKKNLPYAYLPFEAEQHGFRQEKNIRRSIEGELNFYSRIFGFVTADDIEPVDIKNFQP